MPNGTQRPFPSARPPLLFKQILSAKVIIARIRRSKMARLMTIGVALLLLATGVCGQQKRLKVYISADMEGVGGVDTWQTQALPPGREYEKFRRLMTLEVNAAIAGAFEAGATEVLVSDSW
jgi:hypothetical protein